MSPKEKKLKLLESFKEQTKVALNFEDKIKKDYSNKATKEDIEVAKVALIEQMNEVKSSFEPLKNELIHSQQEVTGVFEQKLQETVRKLKEEAISDFKKLEVAQNKSELDIMNRINTVAERAKPLEVIDGGEI